MRTILVLLALAVAFVYAKAPRWHQLESVKYDHEAYTKDFNKKYESEAEATLRRSIFNRKLAEIVSHNKRADVSWKKGVNQFTDRTEDELRVVRGYRREIGHHYRQNVAADYHVRSGKPLPDSVDYRKQAGVLSPVKDQGQCGSCWTFATAETLESAVFLRTGQAQDLSEQQVASCTSNPLQCGGAGGCTGGTAEVGYASILANGGLSSEWTYPYVSYFGKDFACLNPDNQTQSPAAKISGYKRIATNSYEDLMDAVANVGPIAISVDASAWNDYEGGIFDGCNHSNPTIDHAVQLVGYGADANGTPYWIVRNSWAPTWGEDGYIRLARIPGRCGIDLDPAAGSGCSGGPPNVTVCGTCGILYDNCYPVVQNFASRKP